jgi:hypothetical protein
MRFRKPITKIVAALLLLLFSQKIGVGLYLHNALHVKSCDQTTLPDQGRGLAKACHCIDDFSVPFDEVSIVLDLSVPFQHKSFHFYSLQTIPVSFLEISASRGPPSHSSDLA